MTVFPSRLFRLTGSALCLAGVLVFLVNVLFTPKILAIENFAESAASTAWAWRLGLASLTGILLIISSVGVFALFEHRKPGKIAGILILILLLVGNALLLAHEWNQWLFVRDMAIHFPDTLNQLEDIDGFTLFDLSAVIGVSAFFLLWVISAIILWAFKIVKWHIPVLIIVGLVSSPIFTIIATPALAAILSTAVVGLGWFLLGLEVIKISNSSQ
ncbi:MAG: hypothetical protein KJN59_03755 [Bacteroidia bacterium]|nr:hypothetical protein [Bacteroidia bacterium]